MKLKPIVTYRLRAEHETHARTALHTRDLMDISDEPEERGGTNEGFAPTEFVLGGLAACSNVISNKIAKANGFKISAMDIEVIAKFDRTGVNLGKHVRVPFPEITLNLAVTADATAAQQETLKNDLQLYCAVANILRESGSVITENWTFSS